VDASKAAMLSAVHFYKKGSKKGFSPETTKAQTG
jgi:hypothetical protein